ncbi:MAG: hypothetical protein ABIH66_11440 [bacterium]
METEMIQSAITTAALSKTINMQYAQLAMLLKNLKLIQQLQMELMQSMGTGTKVNLVA